MRGALEGSARELQSWEASSALRPLFEGRRTRLCREWPVYMSYGAPCRCTCGARRHASLQTRAPPRQQRYERSKLVRQPRLSGPSPIVTTFSSSSSGVSSLAEGVAGDDADAFVELLSALSRRESVAYSGADSPGTQLQRSASIGCALSSASVISGSKGSSASVSPMRLPSNELSSSERLVVQLFMDEADNKEREAAAKEQEEREEQECDRPATDEDVWPDCKDVEAVCRRPRVGLGDLVVPSTLAFLVLAAVLATNALLAVEYYAKRLWLCVATLGMMHVPSLVFFVARIYSVASRSSLKERFMNALVLVWYVVTLPLLHCVPLLTLSSVLFDKVMMVMGDPSDMRPFIARQQEMAFGDLVWVAVLHAFPQAVLQLHLLLFAEGAGNRLLRGEWPDYTGMLQAGSAMSCVLLVACVATFYSKYVVRGREEETTDGSTTYETTNSTALQDNDDTCAGYLLKFAAWVLIASARVIAGASLLAAYFGPAVAALGLLHVPVVLLWSLACRSRYSAAKFLGDIGLGIITVVFVLDYRSLNREGLASAMSSVVFLCAAFLENSTCLALAYFAVGGAPPHYTVLLVLVGTHYVAMTCGVFLLLCHFRMRHCKSEYVF